jgi:hypothetical protein
MRKVVIFLFIALAFHFTSRFCREKTDGFSVALIHSGLTFNPAWETPPASCELDPIFSQKFHYLGCGGQSFAFVSDDGLYVIKFFKFRLFRQPYHFFLTRPQRGAFEVSRLRKLHRTLFKLRRDFTSYKVAYEDLQHESGLIYLHLNKEFNIKRTVHIVDKIGIEHAIDLDGIEFALQKKADPILPRIAEQMAKRDLDAARESISAILETLVHRCQKGVFDEDPRLYNNLGFIGGKAIFIDIGRFVRDPSRKDPAIYLADLKRITDKSLRGWLQSNYPELVSVLDEELSKLETSP